MLTLLPSCPTDQFYTRLDVSSQEELDAFRKTPNHPLIVIAGHYFEGTAELPKGATCQSYLVVPDDEPLLFRRESGNSVVLMRKPTKRHKPRYYPVSLCMNKAQSEACLARREAIGRAAVYARLAADPLRSCMTVRQLLMHLERSVPIEDRDKTLVLLSSDSEGNCYSPIGSFDLSYRDADSYVAAPSQIYKQADGRTGVSSVEFVPRGPEDKLDGRTPPETPADSRRHAIVIYPST